MFKFGASETADGNRQTSKKVFIAEILKKPLKNIQFASHVGENITFISVFDFNRKYELFYNQ